MPNNDKYNGWTNRETWAVYTYLTNTENTYNWWREHISDLKNIAPTSRQVKDGIWSEREFVRFSLSDRLKEEHENIWNDAMERDGALSAETCKCLYDIGSLWRVNWDEIAKALIGDAE